MLRMNGTEGPNRRLIWWLLCLLGCWAAAGAAAAQQAQTATAHALEKHAAAAQTTYRVINLGVDGHSTLPAINASGQVAFTAVHAVGGGFINRASFYDGIAVRDIGTLGGSEAYTTALNDAGQVTGISTSSDPFVNYHAFVWSNAGGMVDLGSFSATTLSYSNAINKRGVVAGYSELPDPDPYRNPVHAFRWSFADGMEDLGTIAMGNSVAYAINDDGQITGYSVAADGNMHAFSWTRATGMIDLGTLGGVFSFGVAVGAEGQVLGNSTVPGELSHPFMWTPDGGMRDLGTAGFAQAWAGAMSANGHVAGWFTVPQVGYHAMSWTRTGGMVDLGTLGGTSSNAMAVNNKGQVAGAAYTSDGQSHAFVWTAKHGMVDLNTRLRNAPAGLRLVEAFAISDDGSIVVGSNAGLVLLQPDRGHKAAPAVGPIAAAEMVNVGVSFDVSVGFSDEDMVGGHEVSWSWGDGSDDQAGNVRASNGAGSGSATHTYTTPGIYSVTANVVDRAGKSAAVSRKIIAYDPSGGFIGGSGSFMSPQGANRMAPIQAGRATFSFTSPSLTSAKAKSAKAQLQFNVVGLNFRSANFRPVAVQGARGQFEGSGTINGAGDYKFTLSTTAGAAASEGEPGRFSLRIWHIDPATRAEVVDYDNRSAGTGVAGGPIVEGRIAVLE